jgi:hypothetical protein
MLFEVRDNVRGLQTRANEGMPEDGYSYAHAGEGEGRDPRVGVSGRRTTMTVTRSLCQIGTQSVPARARRRRGISQLGDEDKFRCIGRGVRVLIGKKPITTRRHNRRNSDLGILF